MLHVPDWKSGRGETNSGSDTRFPCIPSDFPFQTGAPFLYSPHHPLRPPLSGSPQPRNALPLPEKGSEDIFEADNYAGRALAEPGIEGAVPQNAIEITAEIAGELRRNLLTPVNTGLEFSERITASNPKELNQYRAVALYSDGSSASKKVDWDLSKVDFGKKGVYYRFRPSEPRAWAQTNPPYRQDFHPLSVPLHDFPHKKTLPA